MIERPILFATPMVRAILDGRKTQTRRIVKGVRRDNCLSLKKPTKTRVGIVTHVLDAPERGLCPYGKPGDRLWVRETFVTGWPCGGDGTPMQFDEDGKELPPKVWYRASQPGLHWVDGDGDLTDHVPWKPSIHMPRWASRITLEVTGVRVERLQDISEADARAEGVAPTGYMATKGAEHIAGFRLLWEQINGAGSWVANPWVWVVEFKRVEQPCT